MTIYYFENDIETKYCNYGNYENAFCKSAQELLNLAKEDLRENGEKIEKFPRIKNKDLPAFDFYAVQSWRDGFGNGTYTEAIFRTKEEAENYIFDKKLRAGIVGQWFGEYKNLWK